MNLTMLFSHLGIALGLGLLVGLQRESVASRLAGLRTFPLITLLGAVSGMLAQSAGPWVLAAGVLALAIVIFSGKETDTRSGHIDPGLTTEIAILLMYGVGALLILGPPEIAIAIGGITAVLLHFKGELQTAVSRLTARDMRVIMQFALISLVILPVLPDRTYGPYQVINPRNIWLMVVLIVGIGLSGYIAYKFFGEKTGLLLSGLLGGMVSSTATTVSFSRQSKLSKSDCRTAAIVILLASTVVYVRVMLEMAAVAPSLLQVAAGPITVLLLIGLAAVAIFSRWSQKAGEKLPEPTNPSELKSALFFAILYGFVLFMVALTTDKFGQFGNRGLYLVAFISGLTDVDAITLSTAQLVRLDRLPVSEAWRLVVAAVLSNLFFKLGTVLFLGARLLKVQLSIILTMTIIVGLLLLKFWPA
jgi:uncharacterized membrane protein (DUF4010 family)